MNLLSILKALGIKISPQIEEAIAKAQQLANNYGNSKEGFIKAVNENGGTESLTKALATLDNPNVARVLTALGHPPESIKQVEILKCRLKYPTTDLKEVYEDIEEDIYLCVNGEHFDEDLAKQAVSEMINAGGTTGEKWSKERTDEAARIVGITENLWDFYYVINMYYSDYNTVIGEDITMAAKLSKAFIEDVDVPEGKAYRYYKYVVKDE